MRVDMTSDISLAERPRAPVELTGGTTLQPPRHQAGGHQRNRPGVDLGPGSRDPAGSLLRGHLSGGRLDLDAGLTGGEPALARGALRIDAPIDPGQRWSHRDLPDGPVAGMGLGQDWLADDHGGCAYRGRAGPLVLVAAGPSARPSQRPLWRRSMDSGRYPRIHDCRGHGARRVGSFAPGMTVVYHSLPGVGIPLPGRNVWR